MKWIEIIRISGLVVEYIVAIDVTRVRFPADAYLRSPSCPCGSLWVLVDPCCKSLWVLVHHCGRPGTFPRYKWEEWGLNPAMAEALWARPRQKRLSWIEDEKTMLP